MTGADVRDSLPYAPAPESAVPAQRWLDEHDRCFGCFIEGSWRPTDGGAAFVTVNPATAAPLARIALGAENEVAAAAHAARTAFVDWCATGGPARAHHLRAIAREVRRHEALFAVVESLDTGMPIRAAWDVADLASRTFDEAADVAQLIESEFPDQAPFGVVGQILSWKTPLATLATKLAPALAAGNTVVVKPSEITPLTALLLAEICQTAGLPAGVVNIVTGDGTTGERVVAWPEFDQITFHGSATAGRSIRAATAGTGKRLSLDLEHEANLIVFEDADLDGAVDGIIHAIRSDQGRIGRLGSRVLAQECVAERLNAKLRARIGALRIGDPLDAGTDLGAVTDPDLVDAIRDLVARGAGEGVPVWQPPSILPQTGSYMVPALFTDVAPAHAIARAPVRGPIVTVSTFRTPSDAVELARRRGGRGDVGLWTQDIDLALEIARRIEAESVWINTTDNAPAALRSGRSGPATMADAGSEHLRPVSELARDRPPRRPGQGPLTGAVPVDVSPEVRRAIEMARSARDWGRRAGAERGRVLLALGEQIIGHARELVDMVAERASADEETVATELRLAAERIFDYAAWTARGEGVVHSPGDRLLALRLTEPVGVIGIVCPPEAPLLGFLSTTLSAVAAGNTVVTVPAGSRPFPTAELHRIFDRAGVPPGVINIVVGPSDQIAAALAAHPDVDGIWYFGEAEGSVAVERGSAGTLARCWVSRGIGLDSMAPRLAERYEFLRHSTRTKTIWIPYGA